MKNIPLVQQGRPPAPKIALEEYEAIACSIDEQGCLTCGDVAVPVTVVTGSDADAVCVDALGNEGKVAVELVGMVAPGERLLVHAGVAIEKLEDDSI